MAVNTNTSAEVGRVMACRVHIRSRDQVYGAEHKCERAHKKAEPPIDPGKTQGTPSSLALQPSPVRGE